MKEKVTLLYVDDEPLNLRLFKHNFKKEFNVITAESGDEGLNQIKTNPNIVAVISDMKMPGMNGVDFIRLAKKKFPNISYFILTGFDINEEITEALDEKLIRKYLKKPFNKQEIEQCISESLN